MIRHLFIFILLIPYAAFGNPKSAFAGKALADKHGIRNTEHTIVFPFHSKPDSISTFFYSIGTEWFNFYCYGQTEDGFWNFSSDFLPSSVNMEFRKNLLEMDKDHSVSVGFAPQVGIAVLATYDIMGEHAALPLYLQYNIGLGATHRSKKDEGRSFSMGPSFNFFNAYYYDFNPSSMISIDIQYSKRTKLDNGRIKFNYFRVGIDPSDQTIPQRGFHFDFGVGRQFGK